VRRTGAMGGRASSEAGAAGAKTWAEVAKQAVGPGAREGVAVLELALAAGPPAAASDAGSATAQDQPVAPRITASCVVQSGKKDQDRFVCLPKFFAGPDLAFCGVFDGHGRDGDLVAEAVALDLPKTAHGLLLSKLKAADAPPLEELVSGVLEGAFDTLQTKLDAEFEHDVVEPTMRLKKEIEEAQKVPLGDIPLPLGSGTTATVFFVSSDKLFTAAVGDSRAVLCRKDPTKVNHVVAEDLTKDQNVAALTEEEKADLEKTTGGSITGRHIAADFVDGMLQLTHSLGDCPLHRKGVVSHKPQIKITDLDDAVLFFMAGSDGLWDHFSSEEAVQYVYVQVRKELEGNDLDQDSVGRAFQTVSRELAKECSSRAASKGHQPDDISILVVSLAAWYE